MNDDQTVIVAFTAREARACLRACEYWSEVLTAAIPGVLEEFELAGTVHPLDSARMILEVAMLSEHVEQ